MKRIVIVLTAVVLLAGCYVPSSIHYDIDVMLPMTPVKNQGKRNICWAYAMLAMIETEHIVRGDSVNLSAVYIDRMMAKRDIPKGVNGHAAMGQTLLTMLDRYGIVPYDVLPDDSPDNLSTPKWVFMLGAKYTPREFAHSVCAPGEYLAMTCWPDSPYYRKIEIPVRDNWERNRLMNIPRDTLRQRTDRALHNRHPVCWESERHAMCIIGLAHDEARKPYYIMKNSWGTDDADGGLVFMPVKEAWDDMVALYMTKEAYYNE